MAAGFYLYGKYEANEFGLTPTYVGEDEQEHSVLLGAPGLTPMHAGKIELARAFNS